MKFQFPSVCRPANTTENQWQDWAWQLRKSMKNQDEFAAYFVLSDSEKAAFQNEVFNIRATPYYAALAGKDPMDPIRRILMPTAAELSPGNQSQLDPLGEKANNPAPRIIHRYPDRVLFLVTDICSVYCRYCTRKHFTGQDQAFIKNSDYQQALEYIRSHSGIREVILSGGDPLTLADTQLEKVLSDLRQIEHIEIIRMGSRMPVVCPMRITPQLTAMIRQYQPVFLMSHFNHPRELTSEAAQALSLFVDHGIPVMNQMVLLNGVNNHPAIVQALSRRLLYLRVKPYYMFQCDPSEGTDHLRTSLEESESIQRELWGNLSGLAMPTLSVDIPSGGGKTTLVPDFETARNSQQRSYQGWDGVQADYINPPLEQHLLPNDFEKYLPEWDQLKSAKKSISEIESVTTANPAETTFQTPEL